MCIRDRDWTGSKGSLTLPIFHHQLRYRLNYSLGDVLSSRTTCLLYTSKDSLQGLLNNSREVGNQLSAQVKNLLRDTTKMGNSIRPVSYTHLRYSVV